MVDATKLITALADTLEKMLRENPAARAEFVVYFVRTIANDCAAGVFDDSDYYSADLSYDEQRQLCAEHGMIWMEYYRRHGVPRRQRVKSCLVKGGEADENDLSYPRAEGQQ